MAVGVYLMDQGIAQDVEFWDYAEPRSTRYLANGVFRVRFDNLDDVDAYLERYGDPDLFINYGREGVPVLRRLRGRCFRVHVPCLRAGLSRLGNHDAECYLVDAERYVDHRSMLYVPVVHLERVTPDGRPPERDFIYLAVRDPGKRHDIVINAVRGTSLSGHFHPVDGSALDLRNTRITTSNWDERDVIELLRSARIAVYPGDYTSNPAAMWECVAAGLPIVVNKAIKGGSHVVVPGVTGELASEDEFLATMKRVLKNRDKYRPRQHFLEHWDTVTLLERYLSFFADMGWKP